jgi:hypothetical protein
VILAVVDLQADQASPVEETIRIHRSAYNVAITARDIITIEGVLALEYVALSEPASSLPPRQARRCMPRPFA